MQKTTLCTIYLIIWVIVPNVENVENSVSGIWLLSRMERTTLCTIGRCTRFYLLGNLGYFVVITFFSFVWPKEKKRKKSHRLRLVRCQKYSRSRFGGVKTRFAQTVTPLLRNTRSIFDALTDAESYCSGWGTRESRDSRETRSIIGYVVFVPNAENVEKILSGIHFYSE